MARGYAGEDSAGQGAFAEDAFAGGDGGEGARGGHTERGHRLADEVLAQDGAERGPAVSAAGEGRGAGALELNVVAQAVAAYYLAEQVGAAVAELGHEIAELMTCVGEGDGLGSLGHAIACENFDAFRACERFGIKAKVRASSVFTLTRRGAATGVGARRA